MISEMNVAMFNLEDNFESSSYLEQKSIESKKTSKSKRSKLQTSLYRNDLLLHQILRKMRKYFMKDFDKVTSYRAKSYKKKD